MAPQWPTMHDPEWWLQVRRVVTFLLGCAVIVDALLASVVNVGELVIGLILVGVLPIDDLFRIVRRGRGGGSDDG
jgi:uncharacterized membrane protein HdeD (DUF308 family)